MLMKSLRDLLKAKRQLGAVGVGVAVAVCGLLGGLQPVCAQNLLDEAVVATTVTLGPMRLYIEPGPQPTAFVNVRSRVTLLAVENPPAGASVTWDAPFGTVAEDAFHLELGELTPPGTYPFSADVELEDGSHAYYAVDLVVVDPLRSSHLLNSAIRARLNGSSDRIIAGFVVEQGPRPEFALQRRVLVRAVGPTLEDLGVGEPLADPKLEIFKSDGTRYEFPAQAAIYFPEFDARVVAQQVGAFPLREDSADLAWVFVLPDGAYTAHITSESGGVGEVLFEVYDVPY